MAMYIGAILVLLHLLHVEAKIEFLKQRHEVRLHYNAPPDLWVATLKAYDPEFPDGEILYTLHEVQDHKYFRLDRETGDLYTQRHVFLRLDKSLSIVIVAYGQTDQAELQHVKIKIVEYNRHTPVFDFDIYRAEVSYVMPLNTTVLTVKASDNDSISYNAELYYTLKSSNYNDYFSMDIKTGEVKIAKKLNPTMGQIELQVLVEDGGSPVRSAVAMIEIVIKTITEPQSIHYKNPTGNTVEVCWQRPVIGYIQGYLIRFREAGVYDDEVRDVNVTSNNITYDGSGFCSVLKGLKPWTDYECRVYGWNAKEIGLGSNVTTFGTRSNFCLQSPCKNGLCTPINAEPGFTCDCHEGHYGKVCNIFNPCVFRPCGDFGTCTNYSDSSYLCACFEGFSGVNCSVFDPCAIKPPPCESGGTCKSNAPNAYKCICPNGYYGRNCQFNNSCLSQPCLNGGICKNISYSDYTCYCQPGFQGKQCEVDIDECISSPCLNDGNCTNMVNNFSCQCPPGFRGRICQEIDYCREETTRLDHGVFHWPSARLGEQSEVPCPVGAFDSKQAAEARTMAIRKCVYSSEKGLEWLPANTTRCKEEGFAIASRVSGEMEMMTADPRNMSVTQFRKATSQMENVVTYALYDRKIAKSMLNVISNMLDVKPDHLEDENETADATERVVDVVKKFASEVVLDKGDKVSFQTENLAVEAIHYDPDSSTSGLKFEALHTPKETNKEEENLNEDISDTPAPTVTVPKEALDKARLQGLQDIRVQFIAFKNAKFFREKNGTVPESNQQVIIASIASADISNLTTPVTFAMPSLGDAPQLCGYWKESEKVWAFDGITTNQSGNVVYCESKHMTAFSVLMDPDPSAGMNQQDRMTLSIISYVGCALSIIGLTLTIITYSIFKCLSRDRSGKILLSLCVSMLLMNLVFIVGSQAPKLYCRKLCISVAILVHYFLLATLSWMCVEAINMYQMLVYVFASSETRFMLKRCLAAWGIPMIIVGVTAGTNVNHYVSSNTFCMLSPAYPLVYYLALLGPCCLILLVNSIVFIMVTRVLFQPRIAGKIGRDGRRKDRVTLAQVRGAFTVMTLLGITWVFGALAFGPARVVFQYIFCILNSLQGFIIFVVRCVQYSEAKAAWIQFLRSGTLKKYRGGALPTTSSQSHSNDSKGANYVSQSSRSASADTSSSGVMSSSTRGDRKISVSSLVQMFRSGSRPSIVSLDRKPSSKVTSSFRDAHTRRRASDGYKPKKKASFPKEDPFEVKEGLFDGDGLNQRPPSIKEGRDTQWQYYCCSMKKPEEFQKELEAQQLTSTPLLSVNPDDLPFIEDESPDPQPSKTRERSSQSDQGYSSAENSPNSSRIIAEHNGDSIPEVSGDENGCDNEATLPIGQSAKETTVAVVPKEDIAMNRTQSMEALVNVEDLKLEIEPLSESFDNVPRKAVIHSKSLGELNSMLLMQNQSPKKVRSASSLPALFFPKEMLAFKKQDQVPLIICNNFDEDVKEPDNVSNKRNSDMEDCFGSASSVDVSKDFINNPLKRTIDGDDIKRTFLKANSYNDALTVDSSENISYMDSSSVEGDSILLVR